MADKSGPQEAVEGVVEGAKGKAKEVFGAVTGRDDVKREGEAQRGEARGATSPRRRPRPNPPAAPPRVRRTPEGQPVA